MKKMLSIGFWEFIARVILRNRIVILCGIVLITVLLALQWKNIRFTQTEANLIPADDQINVDYNAFLKNFGEDHPIVAERRNNLGTGWSEKGDYDKAIAYYEQALASGLKNYGEDHPDLATRRNNLGAAWSSKGDYDKAIPYYEQALAFYSKSLGGNYPDPEKLALKLKNARAKLLASKT